MGATLKLLLTVMGAFFILSSYGEQKVNICETQKIKIVSAFCIDGKWIFNLYDGVRNEFVSVRQERRNARGFFVEYFDIKKQKAIISTPRGKFVISLASSS